MVDAFGSGRQRWHPSYVPDPSKGNLRSSTPQNMAGSDAMLSHVHGENKVLNPLEYGLPMGTLVSDNPPHPTEWRKWENVGNSWDNPPEMMV